ncbi:MAG: hypothetical protein O7F74_09780, partial [Bacteroidetes bacterium]|nr:hypothetical protein [Bacteroidota bacterium]
LMLSILSLVFYFRAMFMRVPYVEIVFITTSVILAVYYLKTLRDTLNSFQDDVKDIKLVLIPLYGSVVFYLLSMGTKLISTIVSEGLGGLGFLLAIVFIWQSLRLKQIVIAGVKNPIYKLILQIKDQALLALFTFVLITGYVGLTTLKLIPPIYFGNMPAAYIEMVRQAEEGKEKVVDGKLRHEVYKDYMDQFLERHAEDTK